MQHRLAILVLVLLPALAGCSTSFDSQCDGYSELDEQVACLDTAFVQLRVGNTEPPDREADRERSAECREGDVARRGETTYECDDGEWFVAGDEDFDEGRWAYKGAEDREEEDEEDRLEDEREDSGRDMCTDFEERDEERDRCQGALEDLDGLYDRTREGVDNDSDADRRSRRIREGLREGRRIVEQELRQRVEGERSREDARERSREEDSGSENEDGRTDD